MKIFFSQCLPHCKNPLDFYETIKPPNAFVLYSATPQGRFSFVLFQPVQYQVAPVCISSLEEWFLAAKKEKNLHTSFSKKSPFAGGVACFLPYENQSVGVQAVFDTWLVFDHHSEQCFLEGWFENEHEAMTWFQSFQTISFVSPSFSPVFLHSRFVPKWTKEEYFLHFQNCQNEIEKGNSFQINLSQKFQTTTNASAWDIFCVATKKNAGSMMAFWQDSHQAVISCSPERLFSVDKNRTILTQPIAGTRKRGNSKTEDDGFIAELQNSVKEQSEHAMMVDLLRNDFGKVARFGSVQVPVFGRIEHYASVMHLVSDVVGVLRCDKTVFDLLEACFPGGTITGAPKKETMKILATEENEPREMYCGSVCYFSYTGEADASIMIRTLQKSKNDIWGRAGGGLVWNANAEKEYEETLHKFAGLENIFTVSSHFS